MVQTSAATRQADVAKLNQEAKLLDLGGAGVGGEGNEFAQVDSRVASRRPRLVQLNLGWENLKKSVKEKQIQLEEAIKEVSLSEH